jgi:hypothetical protein
MSALAFLMLATFSNASVECVPASPSPLQALEVEPIASATIPYPAIDPQQVVDVFMVAVDRGELVVFGVPLAASVLVPRQVEYLYSLKSRLPTIRVHAVLNPPIAIPGAPGVRGTAVTGTLDWSGSIIDSVIHCE